MSHMSLETADTVPGGETHVGLGGSFTHLSQPEDTGENEVSAVPQVALWGRHGLSDRVELRGGLWSPLGLQAGTKVQILGAHREAGFSLAVGADLGFTAFKLSSDENHPLSTFAAYHFPLYTSYRTSKTASFYVTPQYTIQRIVSDGERSTRRMPSLTLGTELGQSPSVLLETTLRYHLGPRQPSFTAAAGLSF